MEQFLLVTMTHIFREDRRFDRGLEGNTKYGLNCRPNPGLFKLHIVN